MKRWTGLAAAALACAGLSGCMLADAFTKPFDRPEPAAEEPAEAPAPRRDPVDPEEKRQMGFHYDPQLFQEGAYRPDELENMITSTGFDGISQQTFAEGGGDYDVDVDRTGKRMAFATTRYSRNPDIVTQSVAGKTVTLYTSDPASDMMPKFSPDGDQIAWCSNRYGNWDILVAAADRTPRTRPRQLTRSAEDEIHPSWSPDGRLLAFSRYSSMDGIWRIWVLDMQTRFMSAVTEGLFPEFRPVAEAGPDGRMLYTLVYQKHRERRVPWYGIWTIPLVVDDNGAVELAGAPRDVVFSDQWAAINPCWSPDGHYIAFASVRKSPGAQWEARIYKADDIWVVHEQGEDLTQITSHSAPDWGPAWGPDPANGSRPGRLFFHSLRNGHENVWSLQPVVAGMVAHASPMPEEAEGATAPDEAMPAE